MMTSFDARVIVGIAGKEFHLDMAITGSRAVVTTAEGRFALDVVYPTEAGLAGKELVPFFMSELMKYGYPVLVRERSVEFRKEVFVMMSRVDYFEVFGVYEVIGGRRRVSTNEVI